MMSESALFVPVQGLDVIDRSHAHLQELIDEARGLAEGGDKDRFAAKLGEYRSYVAGHFAQEEVMMRGTGFPGAEDLTRIHVDLLRRVDELVGAASSDLARAPALVRTLAGLLRDHEIKDDCGFHDFYERLGATSVEWKDELATGIDWIDEDHRSLFKRLDLLERRIGDGADQQEIRDSLEQFVIGARQHFGREEQELMRQGKGAESEHHKAHVALLRDLGEMMDAFDRHSSTLLAVDYLKYWVVDHVRRIDRKDFGPIRS